MKCFLRIGNDTLEDAVFCRSIKYAEDEFRAVAEEFVRFGNVPPSATIHIANTRDEVVEYPDFFLELGPRGGVMRGGC